MEMFQKPSLSIDIPQKPQPGDLPPKPLPLELTQKPQVGDLPPKPGELPPKPQLGDLPPKPQLGDLPPKPQMKDLPPKPQLGELLAKTQGGEAAAKPQPSEANQKSHSIDLSPNVQSRETVQRQASEESNDLTHTLPETPVPLPRKINMVGITPAPWKYPWKALKLLQDFLCTLELCTQGNIKLWAGVGNEGLFLCPTVASANVGGFSFCCMLKQILAT